MGEISLRHGSLMRYGRSRYTSNRSPQSVRATITQSKLREGKG
jgi:hypothetical protein